MRTHILRCPITSLTIESAELSSLFYFLSCFWLLSWSPRQVERRPNSKVPYVHSRSLCRISQWVTQEVDVLVFPALNCDLLWTLTSSEPRDKPCRHLGCHDKHKPGSAGRLSLIQRLLCKSVPSRFEFQWFLPAPNLFQLLCLVSLFRR